MAGETKSEQITFTRYVLSSKWTWISLAATAAFWLYALAIENVITADSPHPLSLELVPDLFSYRFSYDLFMNIGTAILVSRIVAAFVGFEEHAVRENYFDRYLDKQKDFYDERIRDVAQSSFRGVYQSRFPDGLINEVLSVGFESKAIRENLTLHYKLRNAPEELNGMVVEATAEYDMTNISTNEIAVPLSLTVPNPIADEMKKHCRLIEYRRNYDVIDCTDAMEKFQSDILQSTSHNVSVELDDIRLAPNETVHIVLVYSMAKEAEDTELMRTGMPTKGLKITIHDETNGPPLWVDATAIHRCRMRDISPPGDRRVKEYRSSEFFLPNQGFIWFWKRREGSNAGKLEDSAAV